MPFVAATRTREALTRFGVDLDAVSVDDAAARVTASVARERLVEALDRLLLGQPKPAGVRALLGRVDADPYRDAVRDAILADDRAKVVELASQKAALEQLSGFAAFLGDSREIGVERRRQLLQSAVSRRPADLGLLMTLSDTCPINQEGGANERLRWNQAAVAAAPANPAAYNNLGIVLRDKPDLAGAEAALREAIRLDPKDAAIHNNLGKVLFVQGRYAEARVAYAIALMLLPGEHALRADLSQRLSDCDRILKLTPRFSALLRGEDNPADNAERLAFARFAYDQKKFAIATRLWAEALASDPKLGDGRQTQYRYSGACAAALSAAGPGAEKPPLDTAAQAKLRGQALDSLTAELTAWEKLLTSGPPQDRPTIVRTLRHWQKDTDLASLRDQAALGKLPADEQKAFTQFWADVSALLKKAEEKPNAGPPPAPKDPEKKPEPAPQPPEKK